MPGQDSPVEVTVRFARFSELYTCAQVIAASFHDDDLFGHYLHPDRDRYPGHMALYFYRDFLSEYFDQSAVFLVSTEKDERGRETITGLAVWHRFGDTARQFGWKLSPWNPRNLLSPLMKVYSTIISLFNPNRALDLSRSDIFQKGEPYLAPYWIGRSDRWQLHLLAVHPDHWNKGIGRSLAAWGIQRARQEGVGAGVIAAYQKDRFYQRCGFREFLGWTGAGEGNPLGAVKGGNAYWTGPEAWTETEVEAEAESISVSASTKADRGQNPAKVLDLVKVVELHTNTDTVSKADREPKARTVEIV